MTKTAVTFTLDLEAIGALLVMAHLACAADLILALVIGCRIRDVGVVRAALIYGLVALFCLFRAYQIAHPGATR